MGYFIVVVKNQKTIPASTRNLAMQIYEIVCTHNIDLLLEAEQIQIANAMVTHEIYCFSLCLHFFLF